MLTAGARSGGECGVPRSCTCSCLLQAARSPSQPHSLPCSGDERGEPVKLLPLRVSAAPEVEVAGLQLVKNQAVPVGQALHLQRESRAAAPPHRCRCRCLATAAALSKNQLQPGACNLTSSIMRYALAYLV